MLAEATITSLVSRLFIGSFFLFGLATNSWAQIIHWEIEGEFSLPTHNDLRIVSGGFDFNTATSSFSNITLASISSDGSGCNPCFNYDDAQGVALAEGALGFYFIERIDFAEPVYRQNLLRVSGADFNLAEPRVHGNLNMLESTYIWLGQPLDPDLYFFDECLECASAVGTLVPIPEPKTYAMLLAGIGLIGLRQHRKFMRNPMSSINGT